MPVDGEANMEVLILETKGQGTTVEAEQWVCFQVVRGGGILVVFLPVLVLVL